MLRLGVLGGTFDPVHVGHVVAAVEARAALHLDRVLLVVANRPWQKEGTRPVTPAQDRYALVEAAVAGIDGLEASRLEIDRGGLSYTVDTATQLLDLHPGAELFLVIGADVAADLGTWARSEELSGLVTLAVVNRAGPRPPRLLPGQPWRAVVVPIPSLEVSSRDLRARAASGRPLDGLVPPAALAELRRRGLYA